MSQLLPSVSTLTDLRRVRAHPVEFWLPAIRAIAHRHGLADGKITRFARGDHPVFAGDDLWVLKLVPPLATEILSREIAMMHSLPASHNLPVSTMLGHGELDGWHYLLSTRVPGIPLHQAWPTLTRMEKEPLAGDFGRMLRRLHDAPLDDRPAAKFADWNYFVRESTARWPTRRGVERVPTPLRDDGPRFLAAAGFREYEMPTTAWRRLHGDLAPENALAQQSGGGWRMAGMIDFGNAMIGDPLFDCTAPTVLLQPGDAVIVRRFLTGAGVAVTTPVASLRTRLMAYTLIHPMGDLRDCLDLIEGGTACATWDEVAVRFWPDETKVTENPHPMSERQQR